MTAELEAHQITLDESYGFDEMFKNQDIYKLRVPSVLGDLTSQTIHQVVPACALLGSAFAERIQLVLSSTGRVVSFDYSVPAPPLNASACATIKIEQLSSLPVLNATIDVIDAEDWCTLKAASPQAFAVSEAARCVYATTRPFNGLQTWAHIASATPTVEARHLRCKPRCVAWHEKQMHNKGAKRLWRQQAHTTCCRSSTGWDAQRMPKRDDSAKKSKNAALILATTNVSELFGATSVELRAAQVIDEDAQVEWGIRDLRADDGAAAGVESVTATEGGADGMMHSLKRDPLIDESPVGGHAARMQRPACRVRGYEPTRIAVCFFGLIRNLDHSLASIDSYLLKPTHKVAEGALDVFVHTLLVPVVGDEHRKGKRRRGPKRYNDQKSRTTLSSTDFLRLRPCKFSAEDQAVIGWDNRLSALARNSWVNRGQNNFYSITDFTNIYRSRYSLSQVGKLAIAHESSMGFLYTHVVAARPDTLFLTPLVWNPVKPMGVRVPNSLHWGGVNDRFAYGDHSSMLFGYMTQFERMQNLDFVSLTTSENFLCKHLVHHQIRVGLTPICNVRVRASGVIEAIDLKYPPTAPHECCNLRLVRDKTTDDTRSCPTERQMCGLVNDPKRCVETTGAPEKDTCKQRHASDCQPCLRLNAEGEPVSF